MRPHAVVFPYPAQGHLNPAMQLAKQLALRGFIITFINTTEFQARMEAAATCAPAVGRPFDIRFALIPDGLPPGFNRFSGNLTPLSRALEGMHTAFQSIVGDLMASSEPATCIFSDMFAPFTQDVADSFSLPRVAMWMQSAASYAVNLHVPLLIRLGHMPVKNRSRVPPPEDMISCVPGHPPFAPSELPSFYKCQDLSDFMVQFKLKPFLRVREAAFVLVNSFHDLEPSMFHILRQEHPNLLAAGPFLPPAFLRTTAESPDPDPRQSPEEDARTGTDLWEEDTECVTWLDKQPRASVLYVSFGSIASVSSQQFEHLALGLEASQARLLLALRPDFVAPPNSTTAPSSPTPHADASPSLLDKIKAKETIFLTSWVPQALVLAHSSVGAFLTHCGWNSTLEGLCMGVPMATWPLFAEQWLNRKWIVDEWKVGLRFHEDEDGLVSKEEVERVVRQAMFGPEAHTMRERARALRDASRKAWRIGGTSFNNLNLVIESLSSSSS